jgi:hypothetical protein
MKPTHSKQLHKRQPHWSEPIIGDEIFNCYELLFDAPSKQAEDLGRLHLKMWDQVQRGDMNAAKFSQFKLFDKLEKCEIDIEAVKIINSICLKLIDNLKNKHQRRIDGDEISINKRLAA